MGEQRFRCGIFLCLYRETYLPDITGAFLVGGCGCPATGMGHGEIPVEADQYGIRQRKHLLQRTNIREMSASAQVVLSQRPTPEVAVASVWLVEGGDGHAVGTVGVFSSELSAQRMAKVCEGDVYEASILDDAGNPYAIWTSTVWIMEGRAEDGYALVHRPRSYKEGYTWESSTPGVTRSVRIPKVVGYTYLVSTASTKKDAESDAKAYLREWCKGKGVKWRYHEL